MQRKESKKRVFFIAKSQKIIFDYIKSGKKKIETRAGTSRNLFVKTGDTAVFICDKKRIEKKIEKVTKFKNISALLKKYKPQFINPEAKDKKDLEQMYYSFPNYKEKIAEFGILAFELE